MALGVAFAFVFGVELIELVELDPSLDALEAGAAGGFEVALRAAEDLADLEAERWTIS